MISNFKNKQMIIIIIGVIVLIGIMGATMKERPFPSWPEIFIRDSLSTVQGMLYKPTQGMTDFLSKLAHFYNIYNENKALKANLDRYAQVSAELEQVKGENERLREMLNIRDNKLKEYSVTTAEVIQRTPDRWNHMITINKGSNDGIKPNMAVVSSKGDLIGRVSSVSTFSSNVELLMDIEKGNYISAVIPGAEPIYGVIEEYVMQKDQGFLIMKKVPKQVKLTKGAYVTTSGLGEVMPQGLMIGVVDSWTDGDYGLTQTVYIRPLANFYQIEQVFVIKKKFIVEQK